jgi:MATE family multidrug resistance protein
MIGLQRMRWALLLQLLLNGSNLILDVIFVLHLGMDSAGVAWASLISEYLACFAGLYLLRNYLKLAFQQRVKPLFEWLRILFEPDKLKAFFEVNGNLFLRTLFLTGAFFFFTSRGAQFGVVVLAANAILLNLLQMLAYGLDGFAQAAEALTGGAFGAKNKRAFHQAVKSSTLLAGITACVLAVLYLIFGTSIITTMSVNSEVVETATQYFPWIIAAPLIAVWSYQFDGIFTGAMATRTMRNTVLLSAIIYVALVFVLTPYIGNHGLWLSMMAFLALRGITLGAAYPKLLKSQDW